jgi:hypothetical protein
MKRGKRGRRGLKRVQLRQELRAQLGFSRCAPPLSVCALRFLASRGGSVRPSGHGGETRTAAHGATATGAANADATCAAASSSAVGPKPASVSLSRAGGGKKARNCAANFSDASAAAPAAVCLLAASWWASASRSILETSARAPWCGSLPVPPACRRVPEAPCCVGPFRVFGISISRKDLEWRAFLTKIPQEKKKNPCSV